MSTAVVVGAGPNGLAAAITLAAKGIDVTVLEATDRIGGGVRSSEYVLPGLVFDDCAAIHVMPAGSRFIKDLGLDRYGLQWKWTDIDCVHPLDDGTAGALYRSVETTAAGLGVDGARWQLLFGGPSRRFDQLSEDIMGPLLRVPRHPLGLARFGAPTVLPASRVAPPSAGTTKMPEASFQSRSAALTCASMVASSSKPNRRTMARLARTWRPCALARANGELRIGNSVRVAHAGASSLTWVREARVGFCCWDGQGGARGCVAMRRAAGRARGSTDACADTVSASCSP